MPAASTPTIRPQPAPRNVSGKLAGARSKVSWVPDSDLEFPQWIVVGRHLGSIGRCSQWWVGDWVRYGTSRWGEKYAEAAKITGYDPKSLRNLAYVASRFELSRRRDNLSWSHHAELAVFDPTEQDRWLDRSVADRLSVSDLRMELRSILRGRNEASRSSTDSYKAPSDALHVICPRCGCEIALHGHSLLEQVPT